MGGPDRIGSRRPAPLPQPEAPAQPARTAPAEEPTAPRPSGRARRLDRFEVEPHRGHAGPHHPAATRPAPEGGLAAGGARETNLAAAERAAHSVYARHGDIAHNLSDRTDVGRLISRAPQVDGNRRTTGDHSTCGGAAALNAMLLDGDGAANGRAIRTVAESMAREGRLRAPATAAELGAISSMEAGHLTPREANRLQGLLTRMTDAVDPADGGAAGTSAPEVAGMMTRLRNAGALANTNELNMHEERVEGGCHWTVSSRTTDGATAYADSWPSTTGYAEVRSGVPTGPEFRSGHSPPPNFEGEFTIQRGRSDRVTSRWIARVHNEEGSRADLPRDGFIGGHRSVGGLLGVSAGDLSFGEDGVRR